MKCTAVIQRRTCNAPMESGGIVACGIVAAIFGSDPIADTEAVQENGSAPTGQTVRRLYFVNAMKSWGSRSGSRST